jgi:NAD-dependent DNA ligase
MNLDKAIHTLEGILKGIGIDSVITEQEVQELRRWRTEQVEFSYRHPFTEIMPKIDDAMKDGVITVEEKDDLLWLCNNFHTGNSYYNALTADIQRLHGILHGVLADGVLSDQEIRNLSEWVAENEHLKGCYPFDEIDSLLTSILADGKIDEKERSTLKAFLDDFVIVGGVPPELIGTRHLSISGVCAACPQITFEGKLFCLTGESPKVSRSEFAKKIAAVGGTFVENVRQDLDYLVVCAEGNYCWAFACYGRKVEKAVTYRKQGARIIIVHENDFWDAVADRGA